MQKGRTLVGSPFFVGAGSIWCSCGRYREQAHSYRYLRWGRNGVY